MNNAKELVSQHDLATIIVEYCGKTTGLRLSMVGDGQLDIHQQTDGRGISLKKEELNEVLVRQDPDGKEFLQINMVNERKILLTDQLVGFKPIPIGDLDLGKLPRVVTTVDLLSVFEAIEEAVSQGTQEARDDAETLKKVYSSILTGGEKVGFDLQKEKMWIKRLPAQLTKTSA